ncbi:hypothetical protein ACJX0J_034610, partial [Zea mays]
AVKMVEKELGLLDDEEEEPEAEREEEEDKDEIEDLRKKQELFLVKRWTQKWTGQAAGAITYSLRSFLFVWARFIFLPSPFAQAIMFIFDRDNLVAMGPQQALGFTFTIAG